MHHNGANSYLFNGIDIYKIKAKHSEVIATAFSKDWTVDDMKTTRLNEYAYDFSAYYDAITVDDILDTHKYFMKNINMI